MASYFEANKVRLSLKMKLSQHCWYKSSLLLIENGSFYVNVGVSKINKYIKSLIPSTINGVSVKIHLEQ
jgi:hypothetical protein